MGTSYFEFFKRTLIVVAVIATPILIWYLFDVVLMAMGAIILAMLLWLGARPLTRWAGFPQSVALAVSGLLILAVIAGAVYLFGTRVLAEFHDVM